MNSPLKSRNQISFASAVASLLFIVGGGLQSFAVTTFLNHFDVGDPGNNGAGPANYSVGDPNEVIPPPAGPGGMIVSGGKFGNALDRRTTGGRVEYATAGNFNPNKGTIEMWIKGPGVVQPSDPNICYNGDICALFGTDTSSGNADIRMYVYADQPNDFKRSIGAYMEVFGDHSQHWEIEQPIPDAKLDDTNWHHVVWEYDTTPGSEVTALWWDGILLANQPDEVSIGSGVRYQIQPLPAFTNTRFHIGEVQAGSATWPGLMDEIRISDNLVYNTNNNFTPPTTPFSVPAFGDYNNNGKVDAADYVVWRNNLNTNVVLPNDSTPGSVTNADYTVWRSNFGQGAGSGSELGAEIAVPEPATAALALLAVLGVPCTNRCRRSDPGR